MTDSEILKNQRAVEHAIAQQRLEGLVVTPETVADLNRAANGEILISNVIDNLYARYAHIEVLQR
ncbi:MAG: antitoxin VbhA family protein [Alphaproteobacteria bacterium]